MWFRPARLAGTAGRTQGSPAARLLWGVPVEPSEHSLDHWQSAVAWSLGVSGKGFAAVLPASFAAARFALMRSRALTRKDALFLILKRLERSALDIAMIALRTLRTFKRPRHTPPAAPLSRRFSFQGSLSATKPKRVH